MKNLTLLFFSLLIINPVLPYVKRATFPPKSKLKDFTVYSKADHVKISWSTVNAKDIVKFIVERSHDAKKFEPLCKVEECIDQPSAMEYFEVDHSPLPGWSYYRVAQILSNGDTVYSHIAPVFFGIDRMKRGEIIVAKDPRDPGTRVIRLEEFQDERVLLVVRDSQGSEYYIHDRLQVKGSKLIIPSSHQVPQGLYTISASSRDELLGLDIIAE